MTPWSCWGPPPHPVVGYVIATGDLDGDGALDLATVGGDVVVLLNRCLP